MDDRSLKVYEFYKDYSQKYEYFITGLIGAVFSYNVQNISPQKLGFNPNTGQILSLVFFFMAIILSLKRLKILSFTVEICKLL